MLPKILEKVFITKKFTHCKILCTLKIDVFEIPDNKNIGILFSKCELLFLNKANYSTDPSHILITQSPQPRSSLPLSLPLLNLFYPTETPFNAILIMFFIGFPFLSYPIRLQPIKFIIKLYTNHNTL